MFAKVGEFPDYTDLSPAEAEELKDADRRLKIDELQFPASAAAGIKASTTVPRKQRPKHPADFSEAYSLDDLYINTDTCSQVYENDELQPASVSVTVSSLWYLRIRKHSSSLSVYSHWLIVVIYFYLYYYLFSTNYIDE